MPRLPCVQLLLAAVLVIRLAGGVRGSGRQPGTAIPPLDTQSNRPRWSDIGYLVKVREGLHKWTNSPVVK